MSTDSSISAPDTRQRLLQAAGEIFAAQGFRQATVRDICEKAGANVAAVNYHFRDKLGLYVAALKHWFSAALDEYPPGGGLPPAAAPAQRLDAFIRSWLNRMLGSGAPAWHGRLIAREMAEPTPGVADALAQSHIRPHAMMLQSIVRDLLGPAASDEQVGRCTASIAGQCLFYVHCRVMIHKLEPMLHFNTIDIDKLADHITRFSLSAIASYRGAPARGGRTRRRAAARKERA